MSRLLKQVEAYRGNGISAGLFYEGKSGRSYLTYCRVEPFTTAKKRSPKKTIRSGCSAIRKPNTVPQRSLYQDIPLEQIVRISCMSARKLQTAFKEYHGCTITEYIQQRRMSQAETLLAKTDLSIGQVAQSVGYTSASRFAELFRKSTGLLPLEYRKVSQRK